MLYVNGVYCRTSLWYHHKFELFYNMFLPCNDKKVILKELITQIITYQMISLIDSNHIKIFNAFKPIQHTTYRNYNKNTQIFKKFNPLTNSPKSWFNIKSKKPKKYIKKQEQKLRRTHTETIANGTRCVRRLCRIPTKTQKVDRRALMMNDLLVVFTISRAISLASRKKVRPDRSAPAGGPRPATEPYLRGLSRLSRICSCETVHAIALCVCF